MKKLFAATLLALCWVCSAQDQLEEVVVTGSRVTWSDYSIPVVTISKKADFMTKSIELVNDSRSPERRPAELIKTIENMVSAARKNNAIELSYGRNFLQPVIINDDILSTIDDDADDEISTIGIVVKVAVDKNRATKDQIAELNKFIESAKLDGRTEIEAYGDVGLSIIDPQQHRMELLGKIAADNQKVAATMGDDCSVKVEGLENRLQWGRGSIDELVLYIVYSTEVEC